MFPQSLKRNMCCLWDTDQCPVWLISNLNYRCNSTNNSLWRNWWPTFLTLCRHGFIFVKVKKSNIFVCARIRERHCARLAWRSHLYRVSDSDNCSDIKRMENGKNENKYRIHMRTTKKRERIYIYTYDETRKQANKFHLKPFCFGTKFNFARTNLSAMLLMLLAKCLFACKLWAKSCFADTVTQVKFFCVPLLLRTKQSSFTNVLWTHFKKKIACYWFPYLGPTLIIYSTSCFFYLNFSLLN